MPESELNQVSGLEICKLIPSAQQAIASASGSIYKWRSDQNAPLKEQAVRMVLDPPGSVLNRMICSRHLLPVPARLVRCKFVVHQRCCEK